MSLTQKSRPSIEPDTFPTTQFFILALVRVSEPIALTSIFPYAWKLILFYHVGTPNEAAFYAGILIAAFSLAEALTGLFWGALSDRIGRKPVLLVGTVGTLISLLILGFAEDFWTALAGRVLGGILNGNVGVIQTMVGELVTNPRHEPKAFSIMPFVWTIGTIVGPALGGYFSEPCTSWPSMFPAGGLFDRLPYLLPNLICSALLFGSIVAAYFYLYETHPDMQSWSTREDLKYSTAETPLMQTPGTTSNAPADIEHESYGTFDSVKSKRSTENETKSKSRASSLERAKRAAPFNKDVMSLIVALGIFTYHSMAFDHLTPIFFQDRRIPSTKHLEGGLGLSTQSVGIIMSINGLLALPIQSLIFPYLANLMGIPRLFLFVTLLHPLAYLVMPLLLLIPSASSSPLVLNFSIYSALVLRSFFAILVYPTILILIKSAARDPSHLGKINGLAASTGGACRTLASPIAGMLYGVGKSIGWAVVPWWAGAGIAAIGAVQAVPIASRMARKLAQSQLKSGIENGERGILKASNVVSIQVAEVHEDDE